jgi:hypothetical protein
MVDLIENQVAELLSCEVERFFTFKLLGGEIPMKIRRVPNSKELLIIFHGAINREKQKIPAFASFIQNLDFVTQLSVSDPSLLIGDKHSAAWYAGHENFQTQKILPKIFNEIISKGAYTRIVFLGGSVGGFASLFYSSFIAGSVAVSFVPQTNINRYNSGHQARYRESCWPALADNGQLAEKICSNLCDWYKTLRPNTIIYLQSAGDHHHTRAQLSPFLATIAGVNEAKFIVNSDFWGRLGHSGSINSSILLLWLRAVFAAPSTKVDDILTTYHTLGGSQRDLQTNQQTADGKEISSEDLNLSKLIYDYQMRKMEN